MGHWFILTNQEWSMFFGLIIYSIGWIWKLNKLENENRKLHIRNVELQEERIKVFQDMEILVYPEKFPLLTAQIVVAKWKNYFSGEKSKWFGNYKIKNNECKNKIQY